MRGRAQDNARSFKDAREQRQYTIHVQCTRSAGGVLRIPKVHAAALRSTRPGYCLPSDAWLDG